MPSSTDYDSYFMNNDAGYYDEIPISDFEYNREQMLFSYPCPCSDLFYISLEELKQGETLARCPSCSLIVCCTNIDLILQNYII